MASAIYFAVMSVFCFYLTCNVKCILRRILQIFATSGQFWYREKATGSVTSS